MKVEKVKINWKKVSNKIDPNNVVDIELIGDTMGDWLVVYYEVEE